MEFFKEVSLFGFDVLKAKKGVRINKDEIEQVGKIINNVGKKIDKAADFVNKNQLSEPILSGASKISKSILIFCSIIFISALLFLIYANSLITSLLVLAVTMWICKLLLLLTTIVAAVVLLVGYAKLK